MKAMPPEYNCYFEPFLGSGSLFFRLMPAVAVLNDLNRELINTYTVVRDQPEKINRIIAKWCPLGEDYYVIRALQPKKAAEAAARFIYLNRFCYNGVYRTNKRGEFNVPRGRQTGALLPPSSIVDFSSRLKNTSLTSTDFEQLLLTATKPGDFVYLDPPYPRARCSGEYGQLSMKDQDLPRLIAVMSELDKSGVQFLLSYPHDALPATLSRSYRISSLIATRQISKRRHTVLESMVSNF